MSGTPPTPFDETSRYGPLFWSCVGLGWVAIGFGVWSLLVRPGATRPIESAAWVVGLALAHDLVLAPLVLLAAWAIRRETPRLARGLVLGTLAISAIVVAYAFPSALRFGAQPDNPSFLPRDVAAGLGLVLALVWLTAGLLLAIRLRRRDREGRTG